MALVVLALAAALAAAEPAEGPDYRAELAARVAAEMEALEAEGDVDGAIRLGRGFCREVEELPDVLYEVALVENRAGRRRRALADYDRVLALEPDHAAARYDRGELRLAAGDVEGAREDFEAAARERPDHWAVHLRLAWIAGLDGDRRAFESHLLDALRNGLDFRVVADDPTWRRWARDPALGPVIERLVTVYSDERILERMRSP